ncbi:MAG: TIGR02453 family protein [Deltaproteobacteria bacterium]|jgi:uncharacterized protein (TIGR02453 family)|nr:TIGR02453 family protein [Deltaproteobacteria bacterium]
MTESYFTQKSLKILSLLGQQNDRLWYREHKNEIEDLLLAPAKNLVVSVGAILRQSCPDLVIMPKVDGSIYRLYRDTRFCKDKNPYKDHLGLIWWQNFPEGKMESPCFYFHLTPNGWIWSVGLYRFPPAVLEAFRQTLLAPKEAKVFLDIVDKLKKLDLCFNPPELKRPPSGLKPLEAVNEWLRRKGLYTWSQELSLEKELFGPEAALYLTKRFNLALPLFQWLVKLFYQTKKSLLEQLPPEGTGPKGPTIKPGHYREDF